MIGILDRVFGCSHKRTTFPIRRAGASETPAGSPKPAYVACLECGAEFDYDWQAMKMGRAALARPDTGFPDWHGHDAVRDLSAEMH